jgi:hypothetical protein
VSSKRRDKDVWSINYLMLMLPPKLQADHGEFRRQGQEQDLPNNAHAGLFFSYLTA